jgi:hypothetical protein
METVNSLLLLTLVRIFKNCTSVWEVLFLAKKPLYSRSLLRTTLCGMVWSGAMYPSSTAATPTHAQAISGSVYQQPSRRTDLNGTHQEDLYVAKSVIRGYLTMCVSILI